jgi:hypothetical protein
MKRTTLAIYAFLAGMAIGLVAASILFDVLDW